MGFSLSGRLTIRLSGTTPWTQLETAIESGLNCQNAQISGITEWEQAHFIPRLPCQGIAAVRLHLEISWHHWLWRGRWRAYSFAAVVQRQWLHGHVYGIRLYGSRRMGQYHFRHARASKQRQQERHISSRLPMMAHTETWPSGVAGMGLAVVALCILRAGWRVPHRSRHNYDGGPVSLEINGNDHVVNNFFAGNQKVNTQATVVLIGGSTMGDFGGGLCTLARTA